jgi:hypothetical protein
MSLKVSVRFKPKKNEKEDSSFGIQFRDDRTIETAHARRPDFSFCFTFDRVFPPDCNQDEVHDFCGEVIFAAIFTLVRTA